MISNSRNTLSLFLLLTINNVNTCWGFSPVTLSASFRKRAGKADFTKYKAADDSEDEVIWTDDDFWAAEKVRQARLSGESSSAGIGIADGDSFDNDTSDILDDEQSLSSSVAGGDKRSGWSQMHPLAKLKLIEKRQQRAIRNKKKNESSQDKKTRLMMTYKNLQVRKENERRKANRVQRPIPLYEKSDDPSKEKVLSSQRIHLSELEVGQERVGTVISMQKFGVYVDVGSSRDALLHISDIKSDGFVAHPRDVFTPGDEVKVWIKYADVDNNKLAVTMVDLPLTDEEDDEEDLIQLDEIDIDDELWGVVKKVTDYGAYVNLGAVVDGFLHFMDHPDWGINRGNHPRDFLTSGQRIRVWVSDIDEELERIKLTGNRPSSLPVIRRASLPKID